MSMSGVKLSAKTGKVGKRSKFFIYPNLLFLPLSPDQTLDQQVSRHASSSILDLLHVQDPDQAVTCQSILYDAYQHLGDINALYGCGGSNLLIEQRRINHILQEQKYFKAMGLIDIELAKGNQGYSSGKPRNKPI